MTRQRLSLRDAVQLLARAIVLPSKPDDPARIEFAVDSALHQALKDALEAGLGAQPDAGPEVDPLRALLAGCALFTIHGENEDAVAQKAISRADKMLSLMRRNKTT